MKERIIAPAETRSIFETDSTSKQDQKVKEKGQLL